MAYIDYRVFDQLIVRVGRFSPSFGAFNLRHDPANHALSSKPLPYDMGRMVRQAEWNLGVLPSPFPDNGLEIGGSHWFAERLQLDYAVYAVTGLKADPGSLDLDWSRSFSGFTALDNNSRPAFGTRLAITLRLGDETDATLGASGMHGSYDEANTLDYSVVGLDLAWRFSATHVRFEYLMRRHRFRAVEQQPLVNPVLAGTEEDILKHGAYLEAVHPALEWLELVGRVDALHRSGNATAGGFLTTTSTVVRYSGGTVLSLGAGWRLKTSVELWTFSERIGGPSDLELGIHLSAVDTF